jgi:hypothetical protein
MSQLFTDTIKIYKRTIKKYPYPVFILFTSKMKAPAAAGAFNKTLYKTTSGLLVGCQRPGLDIGNDETSHGYLLWARYIYITVR